VKPKPHTQPRLPHLYVPRNKVAASADRTPGSEVTKQVRSALQRGFNFPSGHPVIVYQLKSTPSIHPSKEKPS
jgi:hypothetical protein